MPIHLENVPVTSYQLGGPDTKENYQLGGPDTKEDYQLGGQDTKEDFFNFGTPANRAPSTPSVSEVVVTKVTDSGSPLLFQAIAACTNNLFEGSEHTGGANFAMGDGSVRFLSPSITADVVEVF